MEEKDNENLKQRKVDHTWANWLFSYFIYSGFLAQHQSFRVAVFIQYVAIIYWAYRDFVGFARVQYDKELRIRLLVNPALP